MPNYGYTAGVPDLDYVKNPRQPDNNNYLANNYFKFEFTRLPTVTYFCQQVNLPGIAFDVARFPTTAGLPHKTPAGQYNYDNLNVSFMVDENMKNWIEVYEWIQSIGILNDISDTIPHNDKFSNAVLTVMSSSYKPNLEITFYDAFPVALSGIEFNSTLPDTIAIISTASFAFNYYTVKTL
jgi:hypothetical protein